ncbi:MAG: histidine kinase [Butyrivibrio sp.]|nr:histidine kinase [Butyrivibrio sp.]
MSDKNVTNMTLKDMEAFDGGRRLSGKEKARNMSIKYKIASMTIIVSLIPMIVLTVLMLIFYNRAIMQRADNQIRENIRIMSDRISSVLSNGEVCSNNLTIEFSNYYNDKSMKQVTKDNKIISQLSQSLLIYNGISSIVFLDKYDRMYSTDPSLYELKKELFESEYVKKLSEEGGKTIMMDQTDNPMTREGKEVITMGKHVINIVTGAPFGYIFINMDKNFLIESSQSEISYYFLYDTDGNIISETEKKDSIYSDTALIENLFSTEENYIRYNKESYLIARDSIKGFPWTIVGITNLNKFNVTGKDLQFILLTTGTVTAILLLASVLFSTNLVTKPLKILHDGAEQIAEGDMSFRFRFRSKDEIGRLGRIFNYMTQRNLELLQQVDEEAEKKREYELALIQEQVKPHFLYNTLDIIIMLIEMNRSKEASRVTKKLANYYKNSLSGSEEIVTIEREIQIIQDYLDLQTMRYNDKFSYEIDVDDSIKGSSIPKMTLQPLVENAIYHGIKNKEGWGKITVTGRTDGNIAILQVTDDGIGMPDEECKRLNRLLEDDDHYGDEQKKLSEEAKITSHDSTKGGSHFGLYSVARRIKLYFGREFGASIESRQNEGTTITIRVPKASEALTLLT